MRYLQQRVSAELPSDGGIKQGRSGVIDRPPPFNSGGSNKPRTAPRPSPLSFSRAVRSGEQSPPPPRPGPVRCRNSALSVPSPCRSPTIFLHRPRPSPLPLSTTTVPACRQRHAWRRHCSPHLDHPFVSLSPRRRRPITAVQTRLAARCMEPFQSRAKPDLIFLVFPPWVAIRGRHKPGNCKHEQLQACCSGRGDNVARFRRKA